MTGEPRRRWWRDRPRRARTSPDGPPPAAVTAHPPEPTLRPTMRPEQEPPPWSRGLVVAGSYEVGERCGAGRTGVVDQVRHLGWAQDLAVKSPQPQLAASPEGLRSFLDEATVWLDLPPHPHLCACHFVRTIDGVPRIFAEYASGGSVAEALSVGWCPTAAEILDVAVQSAWALQAVHDAGQVHQDIRLSKVLRTADGTVKLLPGPGQARKVNAKARAGDVWSWAASVLEMFAGRPTWQEDSGVGKALAAYAAQPLPGRPGLPEPVAALLRDCLAPRASARPDSLRLVADRLIDVCRAESGTPYPRRAAQAAPGTAEAAEHGADSLNNKALSLLDLGRLEEAERCWEQALRIDPRHPDTTYNRGLLRWRAGRLGDRTLVDELQAVAAHPGAAEARNGYLLGRVHLERGDGAAAEDVLTEAARKAPDDPGIAAALDTATKRRATNPDARTSGTRTLTGHSQKIWSVAITDDGRHALSGGFDGAVRWWDLDTGECLRTLTHDDAVTSVALTPDGRHALTCSVDGAAYRWELPSGRRVGTLDGRFLSAAITPDARHALTGNLDGTVQLWDLHADRWLFTMAGHEKAVASVTLTPDARYGLSCAPPTAHLWDLASGSCLATITGDVKSATLAADGQVLTGHDDGEVKLWDVSAEPSRRCVRNLTGHIGSAHTVAITADAQYVLSGGRDGTVRWWDLASGRCIRTLTDHTDAVVSVAITPDGRHALSGGYDNTVRFSEVSGGVDAPWSYSRPHTAAELTAQTTEFRTRLDQARRSLDDGDVTAAVAELRQARNIPGLARHPVLRELWRQAGRSGRRTRFLDARERGVLTGHTRAVATVAITPDGRRAVSSSGDKSVRWWDLETGECLRTLTDHTGTVWSVTVTEDGRHALSGSKDKSIRCWELDTGRCLYTLTGHTDQVSALAATPDGRHALSGSYDNSLRLWDLDTRQCLRVLPGHTDGVCAVAITPDGSHAVSGGFDRTMRWWDLSDGRCLGTFTDHTDAVLSVAITRDGRHALSGGDGTVRWWDLRAGECLRALTGHTDTVYAVALTPDARHVLSGSMDATVRLWDLEAGQCLRTLTGHTGTVWSVAMAPTATRALSGSQDFSLRLWDLDWDYEFP